MRITTLPFFAALLFTAACNGNKEQILARWPNDIPKLARINTNTPGTYTLMQYYENGQPRSQKLFVDSIQNGPDLAWWPNGEQLGTCTYKNGKMDGDVFEFHDDGTPMFKGHQVQGQLMGQAMHYYTNGKPETDIFYRIGKALMVNCWDSTGTQQVRNGTGTRRYADIIDKDKHGPHAAINVVIEAPYKDSLHNGIRKTYNATTNQLLLEETFSNDSLLSAIWK